MNLITISACIIVACIALYALYRLRVMADAMEARKLHELAEQEETRRTKASHEPDYGPAEMVKDFLAACILAVIALGMLILAFAY